MLSSCRTFALAAAWLAGPAGLTALIFGWVQPGVLLLMCTGGLAFVAHRLRLAQFWSAARPHTPRLLHLDVAMAVRPTVLGHQPNLGYRLACLFFQTGLVDRTRRAQSGLNFEIIDQIPPVPASADDVPSFADLCTARARQIVGEARRRNQRIHLLWSGGIDSTTACVALIEALGDDTSRLHIFETAASRREYPLFSKTVLGKTYKRHRIASAGDAFRKGAIVVTGEYGDQLFGSAKALDQSLPRLNGPWEAGLYAMLREQLGSELRAGRAYGFLSPAIRSAPVTIPNLWTALWWLNFSMKWQPVGLRMFPATRKLTLAEFRECTFHFFGTDDFQRWALAHAGKGLGRDLSTYKWPARDVIRAATGDEAYAASKAKEPSLRGMIPKALTGAALAVDTSGTTLFQPFDLTLKAAGSATSGASDDGNGISFEYGVGGGETKSRGPNDERDFNPEREQPLWDGVCSDGE